MDTTQSRDSTGFERKKGRVFTRPFGTFQTHEVSAFSYFGVSVFGVAGLGAPVPVGDFGAAGLAVAPAPLGAGGAATPDCTLYASTTFFVISTASGFHQSTGLCGQGFEVSTISVYPFSWAYFTTSGAIFERMRLAMSCC